MQLFLRVLGCDVAVRCGDKTANTLLRECYSAFLVPGDTGPRPALVYDVALIGRDGGWMLSCGETTIRCRDSYDLLYEFEKGMTERLQLIRDDLFFVHGAALALAERCVIVSGASGSGKSSLAWCLSHGGFQYLSDELAPIEPSARVVEPYPHALCLKTPPLCEPALPNSTQYTAASNHVPAYELPTRALDQSCPLSFLVFIDSTVCGRDLEIRSIGNAESATRLYSNGLNQLSHPGEGLPVAAAIVSNVPSFLMSGGTVEKRAQAVRNLFDSTAAHWIEH